MCGICGIYEPRPAMDAGASEKRKDRVARMMARLHHRGPDGQSQWSDDQVTLGHTRLAIMDLSEAGAQPMMNDAGDMACAVNGEIYNYPVLREAMVLQGHAFNSACDSEIVLPLYVTHGTDALTQLNGMFAMALWDGQKKRMVLARDRLGIKPIYYHVADDRAVTFASEIKAILAAFDTDRWIIDEEGLAQYLTYQNQFGARTLFEGIYMLEPGCFLDISANGVEQKRYWTPKLAQCSETGFEQSVAAFRITLDESIARHLMSDVGVASYLSAGFDSCSVATTAAKLLDEPPKTFTGRFPEGGWYDEMSGASLVAKRIDAPHNGVDITAEKAIAEMDNLVLALDGPQMGMGALPQYLVARDAAKQAKVILTGHGGDELFSGYPVFKLAQLLSPASLKPVDLWRTLTSIRLMEWPHIVYFTLSLIKGGEAGHFLPVLFSRNQQKKALKPSVWQRLKRQNPAAPLGTIKADAVSLYERVLMTYLNIYLPGLLTVEDKISMAHSLESRTPLLDNAMVDLSLTTDAATKIHCGALKAIIKEGMRDQLPPELYTLPKRGFPTPLRTWLRGSITDWMVERIAGKDSRLTAIFTPDYLSRTVENYQKGWKRHFRPLDELPSHRMWMLLSLEAWLRLTKEKWGIRLEMKDRA